MKNGFTLIELLIVMVIVGILVTVALPKYNASLERARAMEAIANLKAASDVINSRYVMNGNVYTRNGVVDGSGNFIAGDFTKSKYFSPVMWAPPAAHSALGLPPCDESAACPLTVRDGGDYILQAYNENGEFTGIIYCKHNEDVADSEKLCSEIGGEYDSRSRLFILQITN